LTVPADPPRSGTENLEVMAEAVNYNAFLLDLVTQAVPVGVTVLDFGAGRGTFALPLRNSGRRVIAVEPENAARQHLEAHGLEAHPAVDAIPPHAVGAVYSLNVLEHIEDDGAALKALFQCMRPGAPLFLYVPAFPILYSAMDARVGHVRRYRKKGLVRLVRDAGFHIERAQYIDSLGFAASLAYRLMGRGDGGIGTGSLRLYDRAVFPLSRRLDAVLGRIAGKNVAVWAYRPA